MLVSLSPGGYFLARRIDVQLQKNAANEFLVFAQNAEEKVFGLDQRRADLAGLVAGEEDYPPSFFCVPLKHKSIPTGEGIIPCLVRPRLRAAFRSCGR